MNWTERQEYYDLIEDEIKFSPKTGQKWLLTLEERHTYEHDILFHVYSEEGDIMILVYEIVDVMKLEIKERLHQLNETLSGNFRIYFSTLRADLPGEMVQENYTEDGSRFKLSLYTKEKVHSYAWEFPNEKFKRIRPVLKLIWAVDQWRHGAKAMGWTERSGGSGSKEGTAGKSRSKKSDPFENEKKMGWDSERSPRKGGRENWDSERSGKGGKSDSGKSRKGNKEDWKSDRDGKSGKTGRLDPFGKSW